jgi:hypothetical protein
MYRQYKCQMKKGQMDKQWSVKHSELKIQQHEPHKKPWINRDG